MADRQMNGPREPSGSNAPSAGDRLHWEDAELTPSSAYLCAITSLSTPPHPLPSSFLNTASCDLPE